MEEESSTTIPKLTLRLHCRRRQNFLTDMLKTDLQTFVHNNSFVVGDMSVSYITASEKKTDTATKV